LTWAEGLTESIAVLGRVESILVKSKVKFVWTKNQHELAQFDAFKSLQGEGLYALA